jgi:ATP-dependent RNA helicase DeaD
MESFEELGLSPELVESLAAEGAEIPTSLQKKAIPVLARGHDLVLRAGPGAGVVAAYGPPLLERVSNEVPGLQVLVLTGDAGRAEGVAESLARLGLHLDVRVAALGEGWALPERAQVLVAPVGPAVRSVQEGVLELGSLVALVVDGGDQIFSMGMGDSLGVVLSGLPDSCQRIVVSLPFSTKVESMVSRFLRRATTVPPRVAGEGSDVPRRGSVLFQVVGEDRLAEAVRAVAALLAGGARHVLTFTRTEDGAADLGDLLALHGFLSGPPGDPDVPVWLGTRDLEGRAALQASEHAASVATLSVDPPSDPDSLDRRHGMGSDALILSLPREVPHVRETAREAGYGLSPHRAPAAASTDEEVGASLPESFMAGLRRVPEESGPSPVMARLLEQYSPETITRVALDVLTGFGAVGESGAGGGPSRASGIPTWVKIFLTVGSRDGVRPGDLVGAIANESGVPGDQVGRIEIRDNYSRVEVHPDSAPTILKALNGITIKGRSVRADYDRGAGRPRSQDGGRRKPRPGRSGE